MKIKGNGKRIVSWSFVVIMLIHLAAFTVVGLFTDSGWRLLIIFLSVLFVMIVIRIIIKNRRSKGPVSTDDAGNGGCR